jgi:hypothetical protein
MEGKIMAKQKKTWVYSPPKPPKPSVPDALKADVEVRAQELVETFLRPKCTKPPPRDKRWNYVIDITTKWHRSYFYFIAVWASPGPNALSPTFESEFARLEYVGNRKFNLAYMRHTGKWWQVHTDLTLDQCLETIRTHELFQPPVG